MHNSLKVYAYETPGHSNDGLGVGRESSIMLRIATSRPFKSSKLGFYKSG